MSYDYFTSVTTTSALNKRTPRRLCDRDKNLPSGSSWGADELTTFRVVVNAKKNRVLPYLRDNTAPCEQVLRSNALLVQLLQPTPNLAGRTELDLVAQYGAPLGQFWAALDEVIGDAAVPIEQREKTKESHVPSSPPDQPASKRTRIAVEHPDMVNSNQIRIGSSSPFQTDSQVSSQDDAFVPDDHDSLVREANTERLLTCFLRYILYSTQSVRDQRHRLECRTPLAATVYLPGEWCVRAEDDGGLRLRLLDLRPGQPDLTAYYQRPRPVDCYHVTFEAKRQFQLIKDGQPTILDNWLGQMTAEALVGRLIRGEGYSRTRYVEYQHLRGTWLIFLCVFG